MERKFDWATDKAIDLIADVNRYSHGQAVELIAATLREIHLRGELKAHLEYLAQAGGIAA